LAKSANANGCHALVPGSEQAWVSATLGSAGPRSVFLGFAVGYLKPKNTPEAALVW